MKEFSQLKIKFYMAIGIRNATQRDENMLSDWISEEDWVLMSDVQRSEFLSTCADDWSANYLDLGAGVE